MPLLVMLPRVVMPRLPLAVVWLPAATTTSWFSQAHVALGEQLAVEGECSGIDSERLAGQQRAAGVLDGEGPGSRVGGVGCVRIDDGQGAAG
ncbi:hypothetical protein, partial [Variovorax sp. JS1663]|uniref:hypothetical protein n=1 Tax=Variovorax sp. JS1663 TaxID=1851577 RepID=UPI001EDD93DF